jgi:hypothetical protein
MASVREEDSIVVAEFRKRVVTYEVIPAFVRLGKGAVDFNTAAEIFNRWVFTLSAKQCAAVEDEAEPTLTITVGDRGRANADAARGAGPTTTDGADAVTRMAKWTERSALFAQDVDPLIPCSLQSMSEFMSRQVLNHPGVNKEGPRAARELGKPPREGHVRPLGRGVQESRDASRQRGRAAGVFAPRRVD